MDQIRTVIRTFKEKLVTEIFPGRTHVPKTLIFAKDDNHADDIVQVVREEFGKGNDFCQKVTYRTGSRRSRRKAKAEDGSEIEIDFWEQVGEKAESIIQSFRNSFNRALPFWSVNSPPAPNHAQWPLPRVAHHSGRAGNFAGSIPSVRTLAPKPIYPEGKLYLNDCWRPHHHDH